MSNEIIKPETNTTIAKYDGMSLEQAAEYLIRSSLVPAGTKKEDAMIVVATAGQLGIHWTLSFSAIGIINKRPCIYGRGMMAIVRRSGLLEDIKETVERGKTDDEIKGVCIVKRKGEPSPKQYEFSVKAAKTAGLWGKPGPWTNFPQRMLTSRARYWALSDTFADVLYGMPAYEEFSGDDDSLRSNARVVESPELAERIEATAGEAEPEPIDVESIGQKWTPEEIAEIEEKGGSAKLF